MSSRRKSSTPCMVRVASYAPEPDNPDMAIDVSVDNDYSDNNNNNGGGSSSGRRHSYPDSAGGSPAKAGAEENPRDPDQQTSPATNQGDSHTTSRPSEHHEEPSQQGCEAKGTTTPPAMPPPPCRQQHRGYECKYCPFSTHSLGDFKDHVDSSHPNVILNPLYLCAVCSFSTKKFDSLTEHNERRHPGETNFKFKRVTLNGQTVLEQSIEGDRDDSPAECDLTGGGDERVPPCGVQQSAAAHQQTVEPTSPSLGGLLRKDQITAVNINGTVIIPEPALLQGLSHVSPVLQRPPNISCVPKIAVPLNAAQYNPSLDSNLTLMASFNRFPYPTHAELSWLTAASKHPEEQIKVWFTTQRLKQGITWSPEEVEEARKKMFNGSIPPAHHTFTAAPCSPSRHALVGGHHHHQHARCSAVTTTTTTTTTAATRVTVASGVLKRPLPGHAAALCGPESKRPVMAVAPHSGDPKEKGLMAPPPPRSPLKERLPMAPPPPAPMDTPKKRQTNAVPLMPPPMSLPPMSLASKGKSLAVAPGNPKAKPAVPLPSIIFPESLTRPYIAPPPIIAPPFKNYLVPHSAAAIASKEKHPPVPHSLPAPDSKLPSSPPHAAPQMRRPPIIQSIRSPLRAPGIPSSGGPKWAEQWGAEPKAGHLRGDKALAPLSEANGVSRDHRGQNNNNNNNNGGIVVTPTGDDATARPKTEPKPRLSVPTQFPLLERMKGKTAEQLKVLEESFLRNSFPTHGDVDRLAAAARLSRHEIESWFLERRALRDNLEQALLNSMGGKKMAADKRSVHQHPQQQQQQQQHQQPAQMNGSHKPSHLKSPPPPPPLLARPIPTPPAPPHAPVSCPLPGQDSRAPPLPAFPPDNFAPLRWPSPEEFLQLEARTGLVRTDLIRWFGGNGGNGGTELPELYRKPGGRAANSSGSPARSTSEDTASGAVRRLSNGGAPEADAARPMEEHAGCLGGQQHPELPDWFSSSIPDGPLIRPRLDAMVHRLRQQSPMELKNGMHNGMAGGGGGGRGGGGHREVFGSWLEDGHLRRGRDLLLERERKMAEDSSGRLTG